MAKKDHQPTSITIQQAEQIAKIFRQKRITHKGLSKFIAQIQAAFAPNMLTQAMVQHIKLIGGMDRESIKMAYQLYGMLVTNPTLTINNQNIQGMVTGRDSRVDSIVRMLDDQRRLPDKPQAALTEPETVLDGSVE
jgi:hypothetical protein